MNVAAPSLLSHQRGTVVGVQVAVARKVQIGGRAILTGIHKTSAKGPIAVHPLGLEGDEQADPSVHGGLHKAIYAYPSEHYGYWKSARQTAGVSLIDDALGFGSLGENLTLRGLLESDVWVGDVLQFSGCALRVTQPREPCFKFNAAMGFNQASKLMAQSGYCGFYLAVERSGFIGAEESFSLILGPRQLGIPESFRAKLFKHLR
jgi:MOSC domain-containing protein YiiM